jgi:hypothetical protein
MENQLVKADAAQQAKQLVISSIAFDLVRAEAPEEEVRAALLPEIRSALPVALRAIAQELAPGGPEDHDHIALSLGRQIGLLKAGLAAEHKEDWMGVAFAELGDLPPDMVIEALRTVRRKARFEGDVVPLVLEIVEPQVARLNTERKHVERLLEIAG